MVEPWLSADDVAAHLGMMKATDSTWIEEMNIPVNGSGGPGKLQASEIDDWSRRGGSARLTHDEGAG